MLYDCISYKYYKRLSPSRLYQPENREKKSSSIEKLRMTLKKMYGTADYFIAISGLVVRNNEY